MVLHKDSRVRDLSNDISAYMRNSRNVSMMQKQSSPRFHSQNDPFTSEDYPDNKSINDIGSDSAYWVLH